jgi:O-antigen/teichoic acid export membrane protein
MRFNNRIFVRIRVLIKRHELLKVFSLTAITTFIKLISTFITGKVLAVYIGPQGIALLGQLSNLSSFFTTISTAGIGNGVTKNIAQLNSNKKSILTFLNTSILITIVASLIVSLILFLFGKYLSIKYLYSEEYSSIFYIFGLCILFYSINQLIISVINGFKNYRLYILVNISINLISLFLTVFLVYFYNVYGALLAFVTVQSIVFFYTLFLIRRESWWINFLSNWNLKINLEVLNELSGFTLITLISGFLTPIAFMIVRGYIIDSISIQNAGLWEALNRISNLYLMLVTASISVYYVPKLASLNSTFEQFIELKKTFKIIIPITIFISFSIYIFRFFIIKVLFTDEFKEVAELMPFQLLGDVFKISSWLFTYLFIAKRMVYTFIIMEFFASFIFVISNCYLIHFYGLYGSTIAYMITYLIYFIISFFIIKRKNHISPEINRLIKNEL